MNNILPKHYSNNLELKNFKGKHFLTDRTKLKILLPGIIFGFLLSLLGVCDQLNLLEGSIRGLIPNRDITSASTLFDTGFFDFCFFVLGLGIMINNIITYLSYNKYFFNGKKITILRRQFFKPKIYKEEKLENYSGVRFRIEFLHWGFCNKNRYIVELYNKNPENCIPLYISTSSQGVRKMWKKYAKNFRLPALINTDEGLKTLELKNLDKSINKLYKQGLIKDDYNSYESLPNGIAYVRKKDKIVIKVRKIVWDTYNILAWLFVTCLVLMTIAFFSKISQFEMQHFVCLLLAFLVVVCIVMILFRKEKLVIKQNKIVNTHKYFLFSRKNNEIFKKDIEAIEVTENPATGRFFVAIISEDNTIDFGRKLDIKTLEWIKKFLVHEIVKQ